MKSEKDNKPAAEKKNPSNEPETKSIKFRSCKLE